MISIKHLHRQHQNCENGLLDPTIEAKRCVFSHGRESVGNPPWERNHHFQGVFNFSTRDLVFKGNHQIRITMCYRPYLNQRSHCCNASIISMTTHSPWTQDMHSSTLFMVYTPEDIRS
jgi:hypothetical protein